MANHVWIAVEDSSPASAPCRILGVSANKSQLCERVEQILDLPWVRQTSPYGIWEGRNRVRTSPLGEVRIERHEITDWPIEPV